MKPPVMDKGEIVIYQREDGKAEISVTLHKESLWLSLNQIAELFGRDKSVVSRHLHKSFQDGELDREATVAFFATVQNEGGRRVERQVECFNLDVIISVGSRVNSKRGTQFRIWANNVLREYLIKGYALNERRLTEREQELRVLKTGIQLLERSVANQARQLDEARTLVAIIADFSTGLEILDDYDYGKLDSKGLTEKEAAILSYKECRDIIGQIKDEFNSPLFGREKDDTLKSSTGQIYPNIRGKRALPFHRGEGSHASLPDREEPLLHRWEQTYCSRHIPVFSERERNTVPAGQDDPDRWEYPCRHYADDCGEQPQRDGNHQKNRHEYSKQGLEDVSTEAP
jgi:hypothetical protein